MLPEITFVAAHGPMKVPLFEAAAEGLKRFGIKSTLIEGKNASSVLVGCWGWKIGQALRARGHEVLVFENGYLGDRSKWISIAWNGLNGRGQFWTPGGLNPSRFYDNFELKPWRQEGDYILIMGQIIGDMSLMDLDLTDFYNDIAIQAALYYKKPVYFRPHPIGHLRRGNFKPDIPVMEGDLQQALDGAYLVITFNSNSAVDAVINGTPALSFDIGSMAYQVTGHDITQRIMPNRKEWAVDLAHKQWTYEEIRKGLFWESLGNLVG